LDGKLNLVYLDEVGFSLFLPLAYTWFTKGKKRALRVPTKRGSYGRINIIGAYVFHGSKETLYYRVIGKNCNVDQVFSFLDTLKVKLHGGSGHYTFSEEGLKEAEALRLTKTEKTTKDSGITAPVQEVQDIEKISKGDYLVVQPSVLTSNTTHEPLLGAKEIDLLAGIGEKEDSAACSVASQASPTKTDQVDSFTEEIHTTVVLDNASFHQGADFATEKEDWVKGHFLLRYLPTYCPQLNFIEGIWRRVKGFLMPRRSYNSVIELAQGILTALNALGAINI
jgi:DDE superfamily endonuclease